jgi:hypothetical protein
VADAGADRAAHGAADADHLRFQRRSWAVQRTAWIASCLVLAAALAGAFGDGPLASRTVVVGDVTFAFERVQRAERPADYRVAAPRPVAIRFSGGAFRDLQPMHDLPGGIAFQREGTPLATVLRLGNPGAGGHDLVLRVAPHEMGFRRGVIAVEGAEPRAVWILVLP